MPPPSGGLGGEFAAVPRHALLVEVGVDDGLLAVAVFAAVAPDGSSIPLWWIVLSTPRADEIRIRTTAVYTNTPIMTTLSGAKAALLGIAALKKSGYGVQTLQEYH